MSKATAIIKRTFTSSVIVLMAVAFPVTSLSAGLVSADGCTAPDDSTYGAGVHHPTGSDAGMFTYQCNGTWTSAYYVYHPETNSRTASYDPDYRYDCAAGQWTMTTYYYSAADNSYHQARTGSSDPGLPTGCPAPAGQTAASSSNGANGTGAGSVTNSGAGSTNSSNSSSNANIGQNNSNQLSMNNGISSSATSGNASVLANTYGGSAASGDASSIATIANLLQSSANVFGPNTTLFQANINGDVNGDFMFDPSAIMNSGANSSNATNGSNKLIVNQNNDTNAQINNTVNVGATSGDATVAQNTNAGDATSGDANAVANLINVINSTVNAGQSFVGVVNINGSLNGDILLPQSLINQLLAATGAGSTNTANSSNNASVTSNNTTNTGINNDVTATAGTGDASVNQNTNAGGATSGKASTNTTLLNLTGSTVIGENDLLVFVNVLGHWVGMIVNAPAGSTAASLGGGISNSGANSSNSTNGSSDLNATSNTTNNLGINNDVNVNAQSGDATVSQNTNAGSARSGNANAAVNILNIAGSNLNLSGMFGVLFINVFGDWNGSFGVNTSAGDPVAAAQTNQSSLSSDAPSQTTAPAAVRQFASFVANTNTQQPALADQTSVTNSAVLGTNVTKPVAATVPSADNQTHASYVLPAIGISIAALMLIGERIVTIRKAHKV